MRAARRRARRERESALVLTAVVLLLAGAAAAEALVGGAPPALPEPVPQDPPAAGMWYCPATATPEETAVLSITALGAEPSVVTVVRYPDGQAVKDEPVQVAPGDQVEVVLPPGHAATPVAVEWKGGPTTAVWRVEGPDTAGARCASAPAPTWHIAGLDTDGRSESVLHLFNPYQRDAVARIVFATPAGRKTLVRTDNIVVPAGRSVRRALEEDQPQQPDLGVTVEVLTGRIVAAGEVRFQPRSGQSGPTGRALLAGTTTARTSWAVSSARQDAAASSWLAVMNPTDDVAAVELRASAPVAGGTTFGELSVPAGGTIRVDLANTSEQPEFGVTAVSANEVPVVVSAVTAEQRPDGHSGVAAAPAGSPATEWALPAISGEGRRSRLALYNAGTEAASVVVHVAGAPQPGWDPIDLPANGWALLDLTDAAAGRPAVAVRVEADSSVVAALKSFAEQGDLRTWVSAATPAVEWAGPSHRPPVRRDRSLSNTPVESVEVRDPQG